MKRHALIASLSALVLSTWAAAPAQAGIITAVGATRLPGFSTGMLGPIGSTPSPNNDNAVSGPTNNINFSIFRNAGGLGAADYEFVVTNSGGVTEYLVSGVVINNTRQPWSHYRFELGFGVGDAFTRSATFDGLDFDGPDRTPGAGSPAFPTVVQTNDLLQFSGRTINSIGVAPFSFRIDVPDGLTRFTLRHTPGTGEVPSVPEPATLVLLGAGLIGLGARARRRLHS